MLFRTRSFRWKSTFQLSVALLGFVFLFGHSIATAAESLRFEVVDNREVQGYTRTKEICQRILNAVPQKYRSAKKWQLHLISITGDRNAFATDDGYIAIDYRFLKETDDAVSWVLGHEITHAVLGHGAILEGFKSNLTGFEKTVESLRKLAVPRYQLATKVERNNEDTADSFAFTLVQKAGYNLNNVKDFLQKEAKEEGSLKRLAKWMDGSHPTDQERAKVAEERVKAEEKVAQTPQRQPDLAQKGGEQIKKTSESRALPNGCSFVLMWTDPETGTKFWSYTFNSSDPCYSWIGWNPQMPKYPGQLDKTIIGEVPGSISLVDDKVARSIVMKIMNFISSKCRVPRDYSEPVEIQLVPEGFNVIAKKGPTAYFEVNPLLVKATFARVMDRKTAQMGNYQSSEYKNFVLGKEQERQVAKGKEEAKKRIDEFLKKNGVQELISYSKLNTNPFLYEGKTIAIRTVFYEMRSSSFALFMKGDGAIFVSGVPNSLFTKQTPVLLAGKVLGKAQGILI